MSLSWEKERLRQVFLKAAILCEDLSRKFYGAALKLFPEQKITLAECEKNHWANIRPVFVLSTGRSGTLLLNALLQTSPDAYAVHHPHPELIRISRRAYEEIHHRPDLYREIFKVAREELLVEAAKKGKIFIETNNRITFFAPVIPHIFPRAVFIHLVRHPADFVRSGIRRKWYSGTHEHDIGRIVPVAGPFRDQWERMSPIEKIGWLWNETNQFIEAFKAQLPEEKLLFVKAEDLFKKVETTRQIFQFIGLSGFNPKTISRKLKRPLNVQKKGEFPPYREWSEKQKEALIRVAPLARKYEYSL